MTTCNLLTLQFITKIIFMKWITREHPKIDRIACPWLIKNFVDREAEFHYVPKEQVFGKANEINAIPYDIPGAEYSHYGDNCTFDFILKKKTNFRNIFKLTIFNGQNLNRLSI